MIRAFVFDLDGTLVETEELKALSYARAATELRPDLNEAEVVAAFGDLVGLSRQEVAVGLTRRFGLENAARDRMVGFGVNTPSAEPPVDGLPSREVARQQPPRATALEDVEDGVQDLARAVSFRPSSP